MATAVPSALREQGDSVVLRAKMWFVVTILSVLTALFTGFDHVTHGPRWWGVCLLIAGGIGMFGPTILRRTNNLVVVGNLTSAMWFLAILGATYVRGGAGAPGMFLAGLVPMIAILCVGSRSGIAWTIVMFLMQGFFVLIYGLGIEVAVQVPEESRQISDTSLAFAATGLLAGVSFASEWYRNAVVKARTVAEDKRLKAELRSRVAQADRLASLGKLSAGVAHEINNPLSYVLSNIEFAKDALSDKDVGTDAWCKELEEALREAIEGGERVRRIVADLNTFSRAGEDKIEDLPIADAVERAAKMAANQIRHQALLSIAEAPDVTVAVDETRLTQVFLNLLMNSTHAMDGKTGENRIDVEFVVTGDSVRVSVRDTGCGITEANLARITDPFFTTKDVGEGTGLGLSVCRNIVEGYGGTLEFSSEVGVGTCATVTLPTSDQTQAASVRAHSVIPQGALDVLLIDDDEKVLHVLKRSLRPHRCELARSGDEALNLIRGTGKYDAILCDIMMPQMTGIDLHDELLQDHPEIAKRFVFLTGGVFGSGITERVIDCGRPVLSKPISQAALRAALAGIQSDNQKHTQK